MLSQRILESFLDYIIDISLKKVYSFFNEGDAPMSRPNYLEQIKSVIERAEPGTIFQASDFSDIADNKTIHMSLARLADQRELQKILRGLYMKPRFSTLLDEYIPPRPDDIANAIARNFGWNICPSDMAALNLTGLSTQVPAVWEYISDGPYKTYKLENCNIAFRHTDRNTELTSVSPKTALIIRAIKALGKENMTEDSIRILSGKINAEEKTQLLLESKYCTSWVYEAIKKICMES